jgi:hypothetical protein
MMSEFNAKKKPMEIGIPLKNERGSGSLQLPRRELDCAFSFGLTHWRGDRGTQSYA